MKSVTGKVKDIVDVRSHVGLSNFAADPLRTLAGYHFTEVTADLMSKWLTRATRVGKGSGVALALAGFRGVGKSHFMSTFGTILEHPELRARLSDPLVSSTAQAIGRRTFPVAFLRRGLEKTLLAELKVALSTIIGSEPDSLSDSLIELLMRASDCAGDTPLVLLIDTAFERSSRVTRDDGAVLAEIAEIAKNLGIFVGIALDDDISGADGANLAISSTFSIDYLDQEHLYKIVDTHIFPKQNRMQPLLHEIYEYYRTAVPNFRWSEERFSSLYPLHPAIMEIAPFVRLYMQDFALLSFASEAGERILGRPANSLIAPDEVFDKVEKSLRKTEILKEAFEAFDRVNTEIVAKTPVVKRLQAKLILKGLFLFSLNEEGASASEIGASMLIFDEQDPRSTIQYVESLLSSFAKAAPDSIAVSSESATGQRYSFKLDGKDDLKEALAAAADHIPDQVVDEILKRVIDERFADSSISEVSERSRENATDCVISWRGGLRKGEIVWGSGQTDLPTRSNDRIDWRVVIDRTGSEAVGTPSDNGSPVIYWRPAALTADELNTIRRFCVIHSDAAFRSQFSDHIAATLQAHAIAVDKIFQRSFLANGVLSIDGLEYNFTEEARSAPSLSQIFTIMLESLFEGRFPMHPYFRHIIRIKDVSTLVSELFGGANPNLDEVQRLAESFGQPLGIVFKPDNLFLPADADEIRELPLAKKIFETVGRDLDDVLELELIFEKLAEGPYGLVREAAYLLLSAMVAARLFEFVTSNGDRISHRSLDLKLIWDDIVGVAIPSETSYSNERLMFWASRLTGKGPFSSLSKTEDRLEILDTLQDWSKTWNTQRVSINFDEIADDLLNTKIWRLAAVSTKSFRIAADSISSLLDNTIALDICLQRIADAFSDSEVEFARHKNDIETVQDFVTGAALREEIMSWVSLCEVTYEPAIDGLRSELLGMLDECAHSLKTTSNVDLQNLWKRFQLQYTQHYLEKHDRAVLSPYLREKLAEIMRTDLWWEFENLSDINGFDPAFRSAAKKTVQQMRQFECRYETQKVLGAAPACGCGFTLTGAQSMESLPQDLWRTVNQGLFAYWETLRQREPELHEVLKKVLTKEKSTTLQKAYADLSDYLTSKTDHRRLTDGEVCLIRRAFDEIGPVRHENGNPDDAHYTAATIDASLVPDIASAVRELNDQLQATPN